MKRKGLLTKLFNLQGGQCFYCGEKMNINRTNSGDAPTVDHIVPKSHGGKKTFENAVCACYSCNQEKADKPFIYFVMKKRHP